MRLPFAVFARPPGLPGLNARRLLPAMAAFAATATLLASAGAQAQQWFDVPPRPDHPNVSIRIGALPDSRQASGNARGKMELRYTAAQTIPGADKGRGRFNRSVTDVLFNCRQSRVGFLPTTSYYMDESLVAAIKDEGLDESQVQFVRFPDGSPQMKALQAACGK
ncbi:hypothetical protein SAMN05428937_4078 [Achromobacter sp. MFA1 R4]|nr:hypothetical protein SAMN05428937_4078 [Achromobacter sp. MFA1 R4]